VKASDPVTSARADRNENLNQERVMSSSSAEPSGTGESLVCKRCGQNRPRLPERPFRGPLGEQVLASICADCWRAWIRTGTMVINEYRLDFANPEHAAIYDQHMKEFLNLT